MVKITNVGIIGMGMISRAHCTNAMKIPDVNLVAATDINSEVLQKVKKLYGIKRTYTNYHDLLIWRELPICKDGDESDFLQELQGKQSLNYKSTTSVRA